MDIQRLLKVFLLISRGVYFNFCSQFFGILIECLIFAHNKRDLGRGRILFFLSLNLKQMMVNLLCEGIL